ncbi:hypothetical protein CT0861_05059, partial [Colletotrichum tofieldiae]
LPSGRSLVLRVTARPGLADAPAPQRYCFNLHSLQFAVKPGIKSSRFGGRGTCRRTRRPASARPSARLAAARLALRGRSSATSRCRVRPASAAASRMPAPGRWSLCAAKSPGGSLTPDMSF